MELFLVIPIIFLVAALLAWVTKIEIAYLFAPAICFIFLWEFVFGLLGYLNLGMEFLVLSIGLTLFFGAIKSGRFRSHLVRSSYAPSTVAFVSLSLISLYKSKDWVLSQWDEFTHWGHVVRIMYEYGALGPSTPTDYTAEKYPPAISLFQYFVMDFSSGWREGLLFWGTHLIVISILVSVLAKSSYKYLSEVALKLFVALAASSVFVNYVDNIYADPVLALAFGFLILVSIQASYQDGRWTALLALTAGFITLTKPTGIYFALAAILINIVATLFNAKLFSGRKIFLPFIPALVALITVGLSWSTWRYYANSFETSIDDVAVNTMNIREEVIANYTSAFFNTSINPSYSISLSALHWTVICGILFVIWAMLNGRQNHKQNIAIGVTFFVTTAGYFLAILISYLTEFGPGEASKLSSYARYMGTWYQGVFFAILILILSEFRLARYFDSNTNSQEENNSVTVPKQVSLYLVAFLTLVLFSSIINPINLLRIEQYKGSLTREPFVPMVKAIKAAGIPEGDRVYIITQHTAGFEYFVLRYELIGAQFGEVPFSIGSPSGESDIWTEPTMDAAKWSETLRDFDFVVLYITTESFKKEFSTLFEGGVVEPNTVYKIKKLANSVVLSKLE
jgi:hypothetical protein